MWGSDWGRDGLVELRGRGWWDVTLSLIQTSRNKNKNNTHTQNKKQQQQQKEKKNWKRRERNTFN